MFDKISRKMLEKPEKEEDKLFIGNRNCKVQCFTVHSEAPELTSLRGYQKGADVKAAVEIQEYVVGHLGPLSAEADLVGNLENVSDEAEYAHMRKVSVHSFGLHPFGHHLVRESASPARVTLH